MNGFAKVDSIHNDISFLDFLDMSLLVLKERYELEIALYIHEKNLAREI